MKLQLMNKLLDADKIYTANFLFAPVVLPINDVGTIVPDNVASDRYFATLIFVKELNDFAIFEFDQKLLDGLLAYRSRYGNMLKFDVLLSRRDGKLNMTIGANNLNNTEDLKIKTEQGIEIYEKLYDAYRNKPSYTVFEMKGRA